MNSRIRYYFWGAGIIAGLVVSALVWCLPGMDDTLPATGATMTGHHAETGPVVPGPAMVTIPDRDEMPWKTAKNESYVPQQENAQSVPARRQGDIAALAEILRSGNSEEKRRALGDLVTADDPRAWVVALGHLLTQDETSPYFAEQLDAFCRTKSPEVIDWLVDRLGRTPSTAVRTRLLMILQKMRGEALTVSLARGLSSPRDDLHRSDCASVLAGKGDVDACWVLLREVARGGASSKVSEEALKRVTSICAQELLIDVLTDNTMPAAARRAAAGALAGQRSHRVMLALRNLSPENTDETVIKESRAALAILEENLPSGVTNSSMDELWF